MGHLARQTAVALALPAPMEPVLFSLSQAVHLVTQHGLRAEYCPSQRRNWMSPAAWHHYLRERLSAVLDETGARIVVFDGVAPYAGLLRARLDHLDTAFVWVRRGMWRHGVNKRALAAGPFFDLILEPGEIATGADVGATARRHDATRVPPICVQEAIQPLPRAEAVAALGLDPDRRTVLVALGVGAINDTAGPTAAALQSVASTPGWQVVVTPGSSVSDPALAGGGRARVHQLVDVYPLARYLSAFDAAVSAAGYNAVHELLQAGVPTVLVPNFATGIDDQQARTDALTAAGLALSADERSAESISASARRLLDPAVRASLSDACSRLPAPTGAAATARILRELEDSFVRHRVSVAERAQVAGLAAQSSVVRMLGPAGMARIRRGLRRPAGTAPDGPLAVRPIVTNDLDPTVLRGSHPVEHVLPDSTPRYLARRLALAYASYDWTVDAPQPAHG